MTNFSVLITTCDDFSDLWGNNKILYELSSRGISRQNIQTALEESEDEDLRANKLFESFKQQGMDNKKITNRLLSRGFSHKAVREAIS